MVLWVILCADGAVSDCVLMVLWVILCANGAVGDIVC